MSPMCSHCKIFGLSDSSCMISIAKIVTTNSSPTEHGNVNGVDKDGLQTVTRKSSEKAHASSSNDQVENQKKNNQSPLENGKPPTDKLKSKMKVPSCKDYRSVQKKNTPPPVVTPP
ncbi:hypothetical protein L6452_35146 [Arctium lappa]|uniref:Uncharacterized protein n=1 Tax=Arctium lappa TaxID=4217 RepID=A0ACB8YLQ1_ARCLA|nr:hypothetical protein L6452_35146 [Arctium lappa]